MTLSSPALGGKAGAGDRRIGVGDPAGGEPGRERAGAIHRRGGQVDQRGARLHHAQEPLADLGELRTARQRQEHHGGIPRRVLRAIARSQALASARRGSGAARRSKPRTRQPDLRSRLAQIGSPITPSPMQPDHDFAHRIDSNCSRHAGCPTRSPDPRRHVPLGRQPVHGSSPRRAPLIPPERHATMYPIGTGVSARGRRLRSHPSNLTWIMPAEGVARLHGGPPLSIFDGSSTAACRPRVAVIGAGVAGLGIGWRLAGRLPGHRVRARRGRTWRIVGCSRHVGRGSRGRARRGTAARAQSGEPAPVAGLP